MQIAQTAVTRPTTTELLEQLVAFDTTSRNSNLKLIGFIRDYLDGLGVAYRISTDAAGQKANLHAIIGPRRGRRPGAQWPCRYGAGRWSGLDRRSVHATPP